MKIDNTNNLSPQGELPESHLDHPSATLSPRLADPKVVVIGAGIAGLSAALDMRDHGLDVVVYEADSRVGGRILSVDDGRGNVTEYGGQLINGVQHSALLEVIEHFGLKKNCLFPVKNDSCRNSYAVDEKLYSEEMLNAGISPLLEQARKLDDQLDNMTLAELVRAAGETLKPEYAKIVCGIAYADLGVAPESISAREFTEWYLSEFLNGRSSFYAADYGQFSVKDGNQQIPLRMAEQLGDRVHTGMKLVAAKSSDNGEGFELSLLLENGKLESVTADIIVFATPYTALRMVDLSGLNLSSGRKAAIEKLEYNNHGKVTSQIYGVDPEDSLGSDVILKVTTDDSKVLGFDAEWVWPEDRSPATNVIVFKELPRDQGPFVRNTSIEEDENISEMTEKLYPSATVFGPNSKVINWGNNPFAGGGYAFLEAGSEEKYPNGLSPEEGGRNIYFCGEHIIFDKNQEPGFMNSALLSGKTVARKILDMTEITDMTEK